MNQEPIIVRTLLEALLAFAEQALQRFPYGYDRSHLFGVALTDPDPEPVPTEAVAVALKVETMFEFDGEPWRNLVGTYATEELHGVALIQGGASERSVDLVMRDGTEFKVRHLERVGPGPDGEPGDGVSFGDDVVLRYTTRGIIREIGRVEGSAGWAMRRVLGLPSGAPAEGSVSCAEVRDRVVHSMVADAAAYAVDADQVQMMLQFLKKERDSLYIATCVSYGLFEDGWEEAVDVARRMAERDGDEDLSALAGWMDGPMWAAYCNERFEGRADAVDRIARLVADGSLDHATASKFLDIAGAEPEDTEPF